MTFSGPLKTVCTDFVTLKRAIGYKYNTQAQILKRFDNFAAKINSSGNRITKELMDAWNRKTAHESDKTHAMRMNAAISLAKFMVEHGLDAYIPQGTPRCRKSTSVFKPYIFSHNEIFCFFQQVDSIPRGLSPYRHLTIPLLFRMYLCCGLRVSEALHLKIGDVDTVNGILTIRNTKFNKDRFVPMASELTRLCDSYHRQTEQQNKEVEYFFASPQGGPYSVKTINKIYRDILLRAGISHGGRGKGPRVHDFRHTFAVRCLQNWVLSGKEITAALPVLSAFLGHADLRGSERYLRLTAELYPDTIARFEYKFGDVLPSTKEP